MKITIIFFILIAKVILACRSHENALKAIKWIRENSKKTDLDLIAKQMDLSKLSEVIKFSREIKEEYKTIDILINNAGVMRVVGEKRTTSDGIVK